MKLSIPELLLPEIILGVVASVLMLMGCSKKLAARKLAPMLAILALVAAFVLEYNRFSGDFTLHDDHNTVRLFHFSAYIKLLTAAIGVLLVLLAWPTNPEGTGNSAMNVGQETGEFFGLMLFSLTGIFLVAGANDLILLFLGIELASIPTYIMVSISRPTPVAQEAGVKYFFLGAMSAAVMLFGFSYLYGSTNGSIKLDDISRFFHEPIGVAAHGFFGWSMLAAVLLITGFGFKIAAVPLHVYAGDVYQGAATPVTAFLSFVPKTAGFVALIKLLFAIGGPRWIFPPEIAKLLWVLAVLTMTFGNVLGLLQLNVKRLLAYSSVAHSGYMLTGIAAMVALANRGSVQTNAMQGVLFYLTAYGVMNAAAFGVLMMLPSRDGKPGTSAETFEDIAGQGRRHVTLGLAMAAACFSLIGIPLTIGFTGKLLLIKPALEGGNNWLVILTMVNAAISAAYYLRIVGTMFLRPEPPVDTSHEIHLPRRTTPVMLAIAISALGSLLLGTVIPFTQMVTNGTHLATEMEGRIAPEKPGAGMRAEAR